MSKPRNFSRLLGLPLVLILLALLELPGRTLPLFARKYNFQCTTCHLAFPKLNAFGRAFKLNGYRLVGQPGTSPWDDKSFPLSLVGDVGYDYMSTLNPADETGARVRTNTSRFQQNAVEFHSAGTLAEKLSFHFDNGFSGTDNTLQGGQANVQFDDLMANGALNLRAGVYDADVPYLASSRRLTHQDYMIPVTLGATGVELNGTSAGWSYAAALINSSRTQGASDSKTLNNFENVYAWASREFGASAATARVYYDCEDPRVADANKSPRLEVDLSALLSFDRGEVIPAFTYEKRSDADSAHVEKTQTGMIEALVLLDEAKRWTLTGRVELQHIPGGTLNAEADHSAAILNLAYYLNPNARVGLEWTRLSSNLNAESRTDEVQAFVHVGY